MGILNRLSNWYFRRSALPYWCVLFLDSAIVMLSGYYGCYLSYGGMGLVSNFWPLTWGLLIILLFYLISFRLFHTYSGVLRYSSFVDLQQVLSATVVAGIAAAILSIALNKSGYKGVAVPLHAGILAQFVISTLLMWLMRVTVKAMYDTMRDSSVKTNVFIYGVKNGAVAMAKGIRNTEDTVFSVVGFVSPDGTLKDQYLMGEPVYEDKPGLLEAAQKAGIKALMVSPLQVEHFREQQSLINDFTQAGIKIFFVPDPQAWDGHSDLKTVQFKEVDVEDLLPRDQIEVDMEAISAQLRGRCILITGAAGSIGSEIVRQVALFGPSNLVLIDQAETPMHDIRLMMAHNWPDIVCETVVGSITNQAFMEKIFSRFKPEYVFHAAAYKHVPMMEDNPAMAVLNNIRGTRVIADLSVRYGVKKFVMVSTDKAVNPTNVMGCSKRICEIYCQSLDRAIRDGKVKGETQFVTTRFGNVLGSNGSVIPIFREQIRNGGPITVTHPDIIRYFMLIPEACKLVLEAGVIGKGGEIFVFDMGKPVRIVDLARRMIAMSGVSGVEIEFTGLRDGEKLYEEVLSDSEKTMPTPNRKIFVAAVREYDYASACDYEDKLLKLAQSGSRLEIVRCMQEIVPEYHSTNEAYK